jgi:hypothetical protein
MQKSKEIFRKYEAARDRSCQKNKDTAEEAFIPATAARRSPATVEPRAANRPQPKEGPPNGKRVAQSGKRLAVYLHHAASPTAEARYPPHRTRNRNSQAYDHDAEGDPGANFRAALRLGRSD